MSYACCNLSYQDFRTSRIDLSDQSLAKSILTGCRFYRCVNTQFFGCQGEAVDFSGVDITNANFDRAASGVILSLREAIWGGITITRVSDWLTQETPRWCFLTNAFVNIGCMQKPLADWEAIGQSIETLRAWASFQQGIDVEGTWAWWEENKQRIRDWYAD